MTSNISREDFCSYQRITFAPRPAKRRSFQLRRPNAKDIGKLYHKVVAHLRRGVEKSILQGNPRITREAIARYLHVPEHQVEQVFHRLVREGMLRQCSNTGAHDTNRSAWGGGGTGWAPSYWELHLPRWQLNAV